MKKNLKRIKKSLEEAIDYAKGNTTGSKTHKVKVIKESDLLPCPNPECRGVGHCWEECFKPGTCIEDINFYNVKIHCTNCWIETPTHDDKQIAMKTWNKRKFNERIYNP